MHFAVWREVTDFLWHLVEIRADIHAVAKDGEAFPSEHSVLSLDNNQSVSGTASPERPPALPNGKYMRFRWMIHDIHMIYVDLL